MSWQVLGKGDALSPCGRYQVWGIYDALGATGRRLSPFLALAPSLAFLPAEAGTLGTHLPAVRMGIRVKFWEGRVQTCTFPSHFA
jgi:hypothetical protein